MAVSCRGLLDSVIFTKAWSMQAGIPVVKSSLYFWKSAFSFRVDKISKWRVYIKLKVSWRRAFPSCMTQTGRDRVNSRRVRTHEKNSGDAVSRLSTIIPSIFCTQSGATIPDKTTWESFPHHVHFPTQQNYFQKDAFAERKPLPPIQCCFPQAPKDQAFFWIHNNIAFRGRGKGKNRYSYDV